MAYETRAINQFRWPLFRFKLKQDKALSSEKDTTQMPKILDGDPNLALSITLKPSSPVAAKTNVTAEAKLTDGTYLLPGYTVKMQIAGGGKATFQGDGQTLPSLITDPLGRVNAVFSFPYTDSGTIQATVTNDPAGGSVSGVQSPAAPYQFAGRALPGGINLYPMVACAANDGSAGDWILAAIVDKTTGAVDASYSGYLVFTVNNHALPKTQTIQVTNGFAQTAFTDTSQETAQVTVALSDYAGISQQQGVSFIDSSTAFNTQLLWQSYSYSGSGTITAYYQLNAHRNPGPVDLYFCLDGNSAAYFPEDAAGTGSYVNDKVWKIPGATISTDYKPIKIKGSGYSGLNLTGKSSKGDDNGICPSTMTPLQLG